MNPARPYICLLIIFILVLASYVLSQGTDTETIYPTGTMAAGSEPVTTTVPQEGAFILTVSPGTVNLGVSGAIATG